MGVAEAVIGGAAAVGSTLIGTKASSKASKAQQKAADAASQAQLDMYYQGREDLAPWREAGEESVNQLRKMLGLSYYVPTEGEAPPVENVLNPEWERWSRTTGPIEVSSVPRPGEYGYGEWLEGRPIPPIVGPSRGPEPPKYIPGEAQPATPGRELVPGTGQMQMGEFTESPGYQFTLSEGQRGIQNVLSGMGKSRSGAHIKAASEYAENMASTEYDNFLRRWYQSLTPYQSMAGIGQTSAGQTTQLGANTAANVGQANLYSGQAQAAGTINQANALTGAITGGANQLLYYNALRNLPNYNNTSNYYPQNYGYYMNPPT